MGGLQDAFGIALPIRFPIGVYLVRELTIGELWQLQTWAGAQVEPPWSRIPADDLEAFAGALYVGGKRWPPRIDTGEAEAAIGPAEWYAQLLMLSPGMDEGDAVASALWMTSEAGIDARFWCRSAWFGDTAKDLGLRLMAPMAGKSANPNPDPPDWPKMVARLCETYGLSPADIRAMTQTEFRTLCDGGENRAGKFSARQLARIGEITAKGEKLLSGPAPSETVGPDPGPTSPA